MTDGQFSRVPSLWRFSEGGKCQAVRREDLLAHLEGAVPGCDEVKLFNALCADGWIEIDDFARYVLTPAATAKYRKFQQCRLLRSGVVRNRALALEMQWSRFRKVVDYYIDCMLHESRRQESLFCDDHHRKFFFPLLDTVAGGWLRALDAQTREIESEVPYHLDDQAAGGYALGEGMRRRRRNLHRLPDRAVRRPQWHGAVSVHSSSPSVRKSVRKMAAPAMPGRRFFGKKDRKSCSPFTLCALLHSFTGRPVFFKTACGETVGIAGAGAAISLRLRVPFGP